MKYVDTYYTDKVIPSDADLNNYIVLGHYICRYNEYTSTIKNCPVKYAFDLKVVSTGARIAPDDTAPQHKAQFCRDYHDGTTYYRVNEYSHGWLPWVQL